MRYDGWSQTPGVAVEQFTASAHRAAGESVPAGDVTAGITVLIADDHPGFRRALETALRRAPGLTLVGSARDGEEAVLMTVQLRPRVVVMDLAMPGMSGVEATRRLMEQREPPAVVALSGSRELMRDAIAAGASSTVLKEADLSELLANIRVVANV
jgi:DNA-binding NarL/FixJ family response regulator